MSNYNYPPQNPEQNPQQNPEQNNSYSVDNTHINLLHNYISTLNNSINYLHDANATIRTLYFIFIYLNNLNNLNNLEHNLEHNSVNRQDEVINRQETEEIEETQETQETEETEEIEETQETQETDNTSDYFQNISRQNLRTLILNNVTYCKYGTINDPINDSCAITQEEFNENDDIIMINECRHIFNCNAVIGWLYQHQTCPNCRYNIIRNSSLIRYSNATSHEIYFLNQTQFRNLITNNIFESFFNGDASGNVLRFSMLR